MRLSDFQYALPEKLIAQKPLARRDQSRLLVVAKQARSIQHRKFFEIVDYLHNGDLLVLNDTRVVATRICGRKDTGGRVEVLLTKKVSAGLWQGMVKPGRRVKVDTTLIFEGGLTAEVVDRTEEGGRILRFDAESDPDELIAAIGQVPLPPYIRRPLEEPGRYQTIYAAADGSAAAPTAGLHFTPALLERIRSAGIQTVFITLHVGIATFRPIRTDNIDDHEMHSEYIEISSEAAEAINSARGRIICVGTTTARALESAAVARRKIAPTRRETRLFIKPPYDFKIVEGLITNFHMPGSTLLVLVSAFAGIELVRRAYMEAVREKYRLLSFGDAMFLY